MKKIEVGKKILAAIIIVSVVFLFLGALTLYVIKGIETATSEFAGLGIMAIPAIVVYTAFNTAFPEELLFRGFLLKRLTHLSTGVVSQLEITSDRSPSSYKKNEGC